MDKAALAQAMKASISEVLEQMFFLPIDFRASEKADAEPEQAPIIAKLSFCGSPSGTFVLLIPAVLAQSVAADFLGAGPQNLSRDQVTGTVLEMVNMLAGGTLSKYDHQALFDLQIPELITTNAGHALTAQAADQIVIRAQTPETRITFKLIIE